ncbi:MAG: outer membrane lipoprotein chaperone LolA [Betaproteobacteria bacterium]|jgi:outer membrane lipoprotein carrier protein|nr:outer membrane lipoprotein chaperone LolA [Betaproteobacteria bacterium]
MIRLLALLCLLAPAVAAASATEALKNFLGQTQTLRARFAQMVLDKNLKPLQQAQGVMQFSRPGKFRWDYQKPYEQVIVGDGSRLWIHDKDLNQVTVRKLDRALGATPAALLAGSNELERDFTLKNLGSDKGLDWLEAVPKNRETIFERIRMGFGKSGLEAMELRDQFGQVTVITFADVERNPKLPTELFRFTPPKGADVITE